MRLDINGKKKNETYLGKINDSNESIKKMEKMEKNLRRIKFTLRIKLAITIFIIVGIIVYLFWVYAAANSLSIEDENIKSVSPTGAPEEYEAILELTISNPTSTSIEIDGITYEAYIEDNYVGEGEKEQFKIEPGIHEQEFLVIFNIRDLPSSVKTLFLQETTNFTIKGEVTIPAKVFGLFTYTTITIPYSVTKEISNKEIETWTSPAPVLLRKPERVPVGSVRLTWTESLAKDFAKYEVHMSTTKGFEPTNDTKVHTIDNIHTTTYEISDLQPTTEYYFKIVVWTTHDQHSISNEETYPLPYINNTQR